MSDLASIMNDAFDRRDQFDANSASAELRAAIASCLTALDTGSLRVAEPVNGSWRVNEWAKKAVLLSFKLASNHVIPGGHTNYFD